MGLRAKIYIYSHILATILIAVYLFKQQYQLNFFDILPFILFGCLFELLRLSAFSMEGQEFAISSGAAIILASIVLFNPLEVLVFVLCYGFAFIISAGIRNIDKALFNITETINVTFITLFVWESLHVSESGLLEYVNIIPLIISMFVFVFVDLLFITLVISLASGESLKSVIKESLDWVLVSYALVSFIGLIIAAAYESFGVFGLIGFTIPLLLMRYNMYLFSKEKEKQVMQLQHFNELLRENNDQLLVTLSQVIDARDNSLFGHSATVAKYALAIGKKLDLSKDQLYDLRRGSLLHDIGKMGISEAILHKPGKLTDEEFKIVKKHTLIGERIISKTQGMEKVGQIIGQHHEHFSGRGYPRGLSGEDILIESRIVTLCDSLDTMLSTRSYKQGWTVDEAMEEVIRCSGTHFDPRVVEALMQVRLEEGDKFFLNSANLGKKDAELIGLLSRDQQEVS